MIDIMSNERVLIVGPTGSGKTHLAKHMIRNWAGPRGGTLICFDEKATLEIPRAQVVTDLKALTEASAGRYVYRPPIELISEPKSKKKLLNAFFWDVYRGKNTILLIDEVNAVVEGASDLPPGLVAIITRGRERNTGLIALTQRPACIPFYFKTEAEHVFAFWLREDDDRKRVSKSLSFDELQEYEFFYINKRSREVAKYRLDGNKLVCLSEKK